MIEYIDTFFSYMNAVVGFFANLFVIVFVLYTVGIIKGSRRTTVPNTMEQTWNQTENLLSGAVRVFQKINQSASAPQIQPQSTEAAAPVQNSN